LPLTIWAVLRKNERDAGRLSASDAYSRWVSIKRRG